MSNESYFGPDADKIRQIAALLRKAASQELSESETAILVIHAAKFALCCNIRDICTAAEAQGVEPAELAMTSVAELFVKCRGALVFVRDLTGYLDSDATLVARFHAIAATRARQFLFHDLEHSDPNGFNLTRNLKTAIRNNPNIHQWPEDDPQFVTLTQCRDLNPTGTDWVLDDVSRLIWEAGKIGDSASEWLEKVLALVAVSPAQRHYAEKSLLLRAFREVSRQMIESDLVGRLKTAGPESDIMRRGRDLIMLVRPLAHAKLDRFVRKKRLSQKERKCMGLALDDFLKDLHANGEPTQSRYEFVRAHWPGLTTDTFDRRFKSPFQTTLDFVHQYIRRGLRGELG